MGTSGAQAGSSGRLTLKQLPEILGEGMPDLPRNGIGRHRLIRAMKQRFGANWRTLPGVSELINDFDGVLELERKVAQIKKIKYTPKGK